MRRHNAISALFLSPFSPGLYRDVAANWRGIGFWYLLFVLVLSWGVVFIPAYRGINRFVRQELPQISKDIPPITLANGKVSSPVPQPYTISDPQTGKAAFVLDTTGKIKSLDDTEAQVLLTETHLYIRDDKGQVQERKLTDLGNANLTIDQEHIMQWAQFAMSWLPIVGVALVLFSLIKDLILILIYGALGLAFSSGFGANLKYGETVRVAAVAMTPMIIVDTLLWLVHVTIPGFFLISAALTIAYVAFGVKSSVGVRTEPPTGGVPYAVGPYPAGPGYSPGAYAPPPANYPAPPPPDYPQR